MISLTSRRTSQLRYCVSEETEILTLQQLQMSTNLNYQSIQFFKYHYGYTSTDSKPLISCFKKMQITGIRFLKMVVSYELQQHRHNFVFPEMTT